jgi:hypothetical protein
MHKSGLFQDLDQSVGIGFLTSASAAPVSGATLLAAHPPDAPLATARVSSQASDASFEEPKASLFL